MKKSKPKPVNADTAKRVMSVRVSDDLRHRMADAIDAQPYRVTVTSLMERGIELAIKELSEMRAKDSK